MSDERPTNKGQERSAEARRAAQEKGAKAYGPGGNPNPDDETETEDPTDPQPV
jgi:hypothetical protein